MPTTKTKNPTLNEQREALAGALEDARDALDKARYRRDHRPNAFVADLLEPLMLPHKDRVATAEESRRVFEALAVSGQLATPVRVGRGYGLQLTDPGVEDGMEKARAKKEEAAAALAKFDRDNADALVEERRKATAEAMKAAIDAGDFEAFDRARAIQQEDDERTETEKSIDRAVRGDYGDWEDDAVRTEPRMTPVGAMTSADLNDPVEAD